MRSDFYLKLNSQPGLPKVFVKQPAIECSQVGLRTLSIQRNIG